MQWRFTLKGSTMALAMAMTLDIVLAEADEADGDRGILWIWFRESQTSHQGSTAFMANLPRAGLSPDILH